MPRLGKGKGKGKGKGQRKGFTRNDDGYRRSTQKRMKDWRKNSGFKRFGTSDWISEIDGFDIDVDQHSLWLVPLAANRSTNPVYANKPGQGESAQILRNLSDSHDHDGIMAIGSLECGTIQSRRRDFICAKVKLSTGEEGWINVAMHHHTWALGEWLMYLKVERINDPVHEIDGRAD